MKVFWVLFLVFLHTIGNLGDPIHGLLIYQTDVPSYLVSVRNASNCHICVGSMLSVLWGLTSVECKNEATYIMPGSWDFWTCSFMDHNTKYYSIEDKQSRDMSEALLYKVKDFDRKHKLLVLPTPPSCCLNYKLSDTGEVEGWSFKTRESKFVMKIFYEVNINEAFSENNTEFLKKFEQMGKGSPLLDKIGLIYGFFRTSTLPFYDIIDEEWIKVQIKN